MKHQKQITVVSLTILTLLSLTSITLINNPFVQAEPIAVFSNLGYSNSQILDDPGVGGHGATFAGNDGYLDIMSVDIWRSTAASGNLRAYLYESDTLTNPLTDASILETSTTVFPMADLPTGQNSLISFDFSSTIQLLSTKEYTVIVILNGTHTGTVWGSYSVTGTNVGRYDATPSVIEPNTLVATNNCARMIVITSSSPAPTSTPSPSVTDLELLEHLEVSNTIQPLNSAEPKTLGINNNYSFNGTIFLGNESLDIVTGQYAYGYSYHSTIDQYTNTTIDTLSSDYNFTGGTFKFTMPKPANATYMVFAVYYTIDGYTGTTVKYYYIQWEGTIYHSLPTEAPTTANPQITAFTNDFISILFPIIVLFGLGCVGAYFAGAYGFLMGVTVGAILGWLWLGLGIWVLLLIVLVDVVCLFSGKMPDFKIRGRE